MAGDAAAPERPSGVSAAVPGVLHRNLARTTRWVHRRVWWIGQRDGCPLASGARAAQIRS